MRHGHDWRDYIEENDIADFMEQGGRLVAFFPHQNAETLYDYTIRLAIRYGWDEVGYISPSDSQAIADAAEDALTYLNDHMSDTTQLTLDRKLYCLYWRDNSLWLEVNES